MIEILYPDCGIPVRFEDLVLASEFIKMLAHNVSVDAWVGLVHQRLPELTDEAREVAQACMGSPA